MPITPYRIPMSITVPNHRCRLAAFMMCGPTVELTRPRESDTLRRTKQVEKHAPCRSRPTSLDGVRTRRWCPARPLPCMLENGANEWVLAAHVGDIVVTKPPRELVLQRSILRRATWVCTEIVTKRKLVGDFDVADRTRVSMMRPPPGLVLAEVEAPRCTWNLGI